MRKLGTNFLHRYFLGWKYHSSLSLRVSFKSHLYTERVAMLSFDDGSSYTDQALHWIKDCQNYEPQIERSTPDPFLTFVNVTEKSVLFENESLYRQGERQPLSQCRGLIGARILSFRYGLYFFVSFFLPSMMWYGRIEPCACGRTMMP